MSEDIKNPAQPAADKRADLAVRVSAVSIAVNALLSVFKLIAGILGKSSAMVSDAVHSVSDVASTLVVVVGVRMAEKKADSHHPYGHERMECVASLILAFMLAGVGVGIGVSAFKKIMADDYASLDIPGILPLIAAVVSILAKEWMFWYTAGTAKKINSGALMADAWHHRSDALSSVGSFIGILFARMGWPVMDAAAGVLISLCIVKAAYDIMIDGVNKMVDHNCDEKTEQEIRRLASETEGVIRVDDLKTRLFGDKIYVDMEIAVNGELKLVEAHAVAESVHSRIEAAFPVCKHCMVHVNPA
ncbi:cation transporter [bacterium]|nr:cation transporter [bacterium]